MRIEDTDVARSSTEFLKSIFEGLEWLGMNADEEPVFQSKRTEEYRKAAHKLLDSKNAYWCYCTPEQLEQERQRARAEGKPPKYPGTCRDLTDGQREAKEKSGIPKVLRFRSPKEGTTVFDDLIRGEISFANELLDDFVILKADGTPTYNFAVVVDDNAMGITQVIRGEDHISNTPRQLLVYRALGFTPPQFAHLGLILGPDGHRLSKRHGATSVLWYREQGYLKEAMLNYIALLGWGTPESEQIFTPEQLIEKFTIGACSKSSSVFDSNKFIWLNGIWMRRLSPGELASRAKPWLKDTALASAPAERIEQAISLEHDKVKLLSDIPGRIDFLFQENFDRTDKALKILGKQGAVALLYEIVEILKNQKNFSTQPLEESIRKYAGDKQASTSSVFHPIRAAVSGRTEGPSLFQMLEFLGSEESVRRIKRTISMLEGTSND